MKVIGLVVLSSMVLLPFPSFGADSPKAPAAAPAKVDHDEIHRMFAQKDAVIAQLRKDLAAVNDAFKALQKKFADEKLLLLQKKFADEKLLVDQQRKLTAAESEFKNWADNPLDATPNATAPTAEMFALSHVSVTRVPDSGWMASFRIKNNGNWKNGDAWAAVVCDDGTVAMLMPIDTKTPGGFFSRVIADPANCIISPGQTSDFLFQEHLGSGLPAGAAGKPIRLDVILIGSDARVNIKHRLTVDELRGVDALL